MFGRHRIGPWGTPGRHLIGALIALLMIILPGAAMALTPGEAMDMFGTEHGDAYTSVFLNQLFGPLFPSASGSSDVTVFSSIIGYFNIIILTIGGILFFYNVTVGILQSAHEGSVLGQRWSSLWAPLRTLFAVGLLVPVPGLGGYNLAQSGVAYIVRGSTSVASFIWAESATLVITGKVAVTAPSAQLSPGVVEVLYQNAVCTVIANRQFATAAPASSTPLYVVNGSEPRFGMADIQGNQRPTGQINVFSYVRDPSNPSSRLMTNICGSFTTPELPEYIQKTLPDDSGAPTFGLPDDNSAAASTAFQNAHLASMMQLSEAFESIAGTHYGAMGSFGSPVPEIGSDIASAIVAANETLSDGIQQTITAAVGGDMEGQASRDALLCRITGDCFEGGANPGENYGEGWIGAGSWYMMIARMNSEIASLTRAQGMARNGDQLDAGRIFIASGGDAGFWGSWGSGGDRGAESSGMISTEETVLLAARYNDAFKKASQGLAALGFAMSIDDLRDLNNTTDPDSLLSAIPGLRSGFVGTTAFIIDKTSPANWANDPMIGITEIGNALINLAGLLIGFSFLAGASVLGVAPIGAGVATALQIPTAAILAAGATMSFVLPMTPFILWVVAVTGYFLLIVEAVVAVNLWGLAHLRMDGDGISGQAGMQGWLMLLSLLMTPVLMIFGFLIGMGIFRVTTALFDIGINQALSGILGGGPIVTMVAIMIYGVMMSVVYMMVIERSFSMVSEFPNRIMQWMGSSVQIGADAGTTKGAVMAGAGTAVGMARAGNKGMAAGGQAARKALVRYKTKATGTE